MFVEIATGALIVKSFVNDVKDIRTGCDEVRTTVCDVKTDIDALCAQVALKGQQMVLDLEQARAYYNDKPAAPAGPAPFYVNVDVGDTELATPYWETAGDIPF